MISISKIIHNIFHFFRKPTIQFRYFKHNGSPFMSVLIENQDIIPSRYMIVKLESLGGTFEVVAINSNFNLAATQKPGKSFTLYGHNICPHHYGAVILKSLEGQGILQPPNIKGDCRCDFKGISSFS